MVYAALKRNAPRGFLDDWHFGYEEVVHNPLCEAKTILDNCEKTFQAILYIIILYCLAHESFVPKFILDDITRFKFSLSYWLAKGNFPI